MNQRTYWTNYNQTNCSFSLEASQQRSLSVALNRVATTSVDLVGVGQQEWMT